MQSQLGPINKTKIFSILLTNRGDMSGGASEWEDILIQKGIIKAPEPTKQSEEIIYNITNDHDNNNDELDSIDDDDFIQSYRYHLSTFY